MWTAKIINATKEKDIILVDVEYTDGVKTFVQTERTYDYESVQAIATKRCAELNQVSQVEIPIGIIPTDVPVVEQTPSEIALEQYADDLNIVLAMKNAISLGVLAEDDTEYVKLLSKLKTNFVIEYLNLFAGRKF